MVVKAERQRATQNLVCQDLYPMVKAILLKLQFSIGANQPSGKGGCYPLSYEQYNESRFCHSGHRNELGR
jgi:hypothetical protein